MVTQTNTAITVDGSSRFAIQLDAPIPEPSHGEIQIQVAFSGANPADIKHTTELGITDTTLGYDFSGTVLKCPSSRFQPGEAVAGYSPTGLGRPFKYGAHQSIMVCPEDMVFRVPSTMPMSHAACLTTVAMTAADALYNEIGLQPHSGMGGDEVNVETEYTTQQRQQNLLIWGASSSVGVCTIQLARASGSVQEIITVASPKHHPLLKSLGATACFDYQDPSVVEQIRAYSTTHGALTACFDAVGAPASADKLEACCDRSSGTKLLSVVARPGKPFQLPFGARNMELRFKLVPAGGMEIVIPAKPELHQRAWSTMVWAVDHYGRGFGLPKVEEFDGSAEEWLEQLKAIAEGRAGFGKFAWKR